MRSAVRGSAALALSAATIVAATGWLYVARPLVRMPGPGVRDALALDELPHRSGVPLLLYACVWIAAGVPDRCPAQQSAIPGLPTGLERRGQRRREPFAFTIRLTVLN